MADRGPAMTGAGRETAKRSGNRARGRTLAVTDERFDADVLGSGLPVLVDFWASWCGPCRLVSPILEELAAEYDGRLRIAKVNTESDHELAFRHGVRGIPTMILFRDGVEVDRTVGALPKPLLKLWVERALRRQHAPGFASLPSSP